jgi:sarcosine oxidase subunit gamma
MAETLTRRSPLQGYESRLATLPESARVTEEPYVAMVDLWLDPASEAAAAATDVLGLPALPSTPSTVTTAGDTSAIWFGPEEWLVCSTECSGEVLEAALQQVIAENGGAAVDVSAQRTTLRLQGGDARNVLAKGCSLDLHSSALRTGMAAQTMLGLAAVVLIPLHDNGTDYRILVRSSFARYLAEWLTDAAEEFGVSWPR